MEMIIAILFFSLASAVCIQLFARSHLLSTQTVNQNHAVVQAQNLAESYLSLEGNVAAMQDLINLTFSMKGLSLRLTFDSCWNLCSAENGGSYQAELVHTPAEGTGIMEAQITVYDLSAPEMPIYTISVMHHTAERRGDHE